MMGKNVSRIRGYPRYDVPSPNVNLGFMGYERQKKSDFLP